MKADLDETASECEKFGVKTFVATPDMANEKQINEGSQKGVYSKFVSAQNFSADLSREILTLPRRCFLRSRRVKCSLSENRIVMSISLQT